MMTHSFSLSLPMNRNGSGTGWQPDATPVYAYMKHGRKWNYMLHGSIFLRYTAQDIGGKGSRGDADWSFPNWFMGMAQRQIGKNGLFTVRTMLSLDRLTDGGNGYPLLFQSGESWGNEPLVDRQHPHDLISELAVGYTQRFNKNIDAYVYLGYPGEPALGPTAFMHRISALNNPDAALGHHWQDATHITFGVATLGFRYKMFKIEGSRFTGREPDENRFDFDRPRFDSYSYRLSVNPNDYFSLQFSQASIKSPEALTPDDNVKRTTASVLNSIPLGAKTHVTSTLAWGLNNKGHGHREHSVLLESNLQLDKLAVYGRYEWVQKDPDELRLSEFNGHETFSINAVTLGANYSIFRQWNTDVAVGAQGTWYGTPTALNPVYGRNPLSGQVYMRIIPALLLNGRRSGEHSRHH